MISIIVAIDKYNAIGKNGDLLCHLPNDLKHFKECTAGHTVIMGKRTWFSLPTHPLPNRRNIVISDDKEDKFEGAEMAYSIEDVLSLIDSSEEAFVIGGGMIYKQFIDLADKLYITHIDNVFDGADTFFPMIDINKFKIDKSEKHYKDEKHQYDYWFIEYIKK